MNSNHWQRIEELFHAASELPAEDRANFLALECSGDELLLREVESLITASEHGNSLIDQGALSLGMKVLSNGQKELLVGQSIGHYKILRLLGEGGMGAVYLAEDSTLERHAALKFITPGLVDDDWARDQLIKEARSVARLENPNICAVYGLEEIGEYNFIAMQYVEGETLASLLSEGPLELERALDLAEQIVSALSAAHLRGIIHRDVKPQNIVVTPEGQAKVLDFGLAKFVKQTGVERSPESLEHTSSLGFVAGTIAYMSPEQTAGEPLDFRTDIFSFGIVLYQMLTGENPFLRKTREDTLQAINTHVPSSPLKISSQVSGELHGIVSTCLEKDRTQRFETTDSLLTALRTERKKFERPDPAVVQARARRRRQFLRRFAVVAMILLAMLLAGSGLAYVKLSTTYSLALLPIENKSADSGADYLSEGLTRNLLDKLRYLPRLKVKAPTVTTSKAGDQPDVVNLARELKVDEVLSGEIIKQGDTLLLHLRMLKAHDGSQTWEQTFNLTTNDLFSVQNDITRKVASALGLWLVGSDRGLLVKRQTDSQEALRAYMRGRHYFLQRDRENIKTAVKYLEQARDLDPAFAKAYAGLAECYALMENVAYGPLTTKEAMDKARYNARQAIEIDPLLPEGHASMAGIKLRHDWDLPQAEAEYKRAIELNPEFAQAHYGYANLLAIRGRFDESIRESEISRDLDPYSQLSKLNYGRALYYARRSDEAEAYFGGLINADPNYAPFQHAMGLVLAQQRRFPEAIICLEKFHSRQKIYGAAALGYVYGKGGRRADALGMVQEIDELAREKPVLPYEKALVYIGIGDQEKALALLEEAYQNQVPNLIYLTTDSIFDELKGNLRFQDLTRRIGLTQ